MKNINFYRLSLGLFLSLGLSSLAGAVDLQQVEKDLQGDGALGWIHGSVESQKIYVFTVRNPKDFFDYVELSLTSDSADIQKKFSSLSRHDQVKVKGSFLDIPAPQKHIDVTSIEVVKAYDSGIPTDPYQHEAVIPEDLLKQTQATFLVHAIAAQGQIMVVEYKDAVVPVYVAKPGLTKDLYRGDVIKLKYKIQHRPQEPVHLNIDDSDPNSPALTVLESVKSFHQKEMTLQGRLILFPKSPEIKFNVFAVEQTLDAGLRRQFTLVNFDSPEIFQKIRESLQAAWDRHPGAYENGRNKLVSQAVQVKVTGLGNEIDPSQANPQILIKDIKDLTIIENP
jgi:hypothetical protein